MPNSPRRGAAPGRLLGGTVPNRGSEDATTVRGEQGVTIQSAVKDSQHLSLTRLNMLTVDRLGGSRE